MSRDLRFRSNWSAKFPGLVRRDMRSAKTPKALENEPKSPFVKHDKEQTNPSTNETNIEALENIILDPRKKRSVELAADVVATSDFAKRVLV